MNCTTAKENHGVRLERSNGGVHQYVDAFNNGDEKAMAAACADPMQILDGMRRMSGTGQPPPRTGAVTRYLCGSCATDLPLNPKFCNE